MQLLQKSFSLITFQAILKHYWYFLYISAVKIIQTQPIKMRQIQLPFCVWNESLWPLCDSQQNLNRQRQRKDLLSIYKLSDGKVLSASKLRLGLGRGTL